MLKKITLKRCFPVSLKRHKLSPSLGTPISSSSHFFSGQTDARSWPCAKFPNFTARKPLGCWPIKPNSSSCSASYFLGFSAECSSQMMPSFGSSVKQPRSCRNGSPVNQIVKVAWRVFQPTWRFPKMEVPPVIIHFFRSFHYKPSNFGVAPFQETSREDWYSLVA